MRRLVLTGIAAVALALTAPGAALAKHHHHKARSHHAHHATRSLHFGPNTATPPSASPSDNAGTVQSFTGGVLTIKLNDNSTVSGQVTPQTELNCESATPATTASEHGSGGGDSSGDSGDSHATPGTPPSSSDDGDGAHGDGEHGDGDHGDTDDGGGTPCDTSALVAGAIVHEAELRIGPAGAVFKSIDLVV
jgi:hypothetical protein